MNDQLAKEQERVSEERRIELLSNELTRENNLIGEVLGFAGIDDSKEALARSFGLSGAGPSLYQSQQETKRVVPWPVNRNFKHKQLDDSDEQVVDSVLGQIFGSGTETEERVAGKFNFYFF